MKFDDFLIALAEYGEKQKIFDETTMLLDANTLEINLIDPDICEVVKQAYSSDERAELLENYVVQLFSSIVNSSERTLLYYYQSDKFCQGCYISNIEFEEDNSITFNFELF